MSIQSLSMAFLVLLASLSVPKSMLAQHALGTAFTYQGQLLSKGNPVDGTCDLLFSLYGEEEEGEAIAGPLNKSLVRVENGLFTTVLDFGDDPYDGSARWLDISVRCPAGAVTIPI